MATQQTTQKVRKGYPFRTLPCPFSWENHIFLGWDTNPNATTPAYAAGEMVQFDEDTTLYAIWSEISPELQQEFDAIDQEYPLPQNIPNDDILPSGDGNVHIEDLVNVDRMAEDIDDIYQNYPELEDASNFTYRQVPDMDNN